MDKEFHYYMTHLIAARSGFNPDEAGLIAKVCQATDENTQVYKVYVDNELVYSNYVSQTSDLLRPRYSRMRIYPVFHFIPGDIDFAGAQRADGNTRRLNTTPDSSLANRCIDDALASNDLYQIGIACHAYADTWAHQNFIGYNDRFNKFDGMLDWVIPNIGHADAKHAPDWPAHIWMDTRLIAVNQRINNKARFLEAAGRLFEKLASYNGHQNIDTERDLLCRDLDIAISKAHENSGNKGKKYRVERYRMLATYPQYNGTEIPAFKLTDWFNQAIWQDLEFGDYYWRDPQNYRNSNWYVFQEAIKQYQRHVLELYEDTAYAEIPADLKEEILNFS